ncbi:hypothetical protein LBMAG25_10270 [Bacteroidota bacterium]|nr:hypothetical protein LBMAG25_10270 [Bacteroidota bacterium]
MQKTCLLNLRSFILFIAFCYFLSVPIACNIINPAEPIPAYIRVHDPKVITLAAQGSASENISNYWLFVNNQAEGVYNRTGNYPLIAEGTTKLAFLAGIKDNGVSNLRVVYPFYTADTITTTLNPNGTIDIYPTFRYISGTQFKVLEDFELGSVLISSNASNPLVRSSLPEDVFEGSFSAKIKLDSITPGIELLSIDPFTLPLLGFDIYIELNYKSDVPFVVGLQSMSTSQKFYQWTITPKSEWNKIYLNAKSLVNTTNNASWKLLIYSAPDTLTGTKYIYLDNVKVLHQ